VEGVDVTSFDRVVVVTGGSGQLGAVISERFARGGDLVFIGYQRRRDRARVIADALRAEGFMAEPFALELADVRAVDEAFRKIIDGCGPVDVLVNNAAHRPIGRFLELTDADWDEVMSINLHGAVRTARAVLPGMVERAHGRIINISGLDALKAGGGRAHVAVAKAALMGLSRAIAIEFAHKGVTANTVVPGAFDTKRDPARYPRWTEMRAHVIAHTPVGRQGHPAELAELCWYLASPAAAYMTGQDIHINGGSYPLERNPLVELD
jgi:3-oxoacyl-[acyl-carrier protein] reductase